MVDMRIIPARAGSSYLHPCNQLSFQDHPRACGEQRTTTPDSIPP